MSTGQVHLQRPVKNGKESTCNAGDLGLISGLGRSPGGGHGNPLQCSCLENPHGQRSLAGYSPWSCKESDMTEWLSAIKEENRRHGNSLGVQWLRIGTFPTEDMGLIPDWGAKIPQAERHGKKQTHQNPKTNNDNNLPQNIRQAQINGHRTRHLASISLDCQS